MEKITSYRDLNVWQKSMDLVIHWKFLFFLLFTLFLMPSAFSANPITIIVNLTPPYTPFLNECGTIGIDKLQVTLIVNDNRMINYPAKIQMFVERVGSGVVMRTGDYASLPPVFLTGGSTEIFSGADLASFFRAGNNVFSGFDQAQYQFTGRIPDGQYRIGFQVVDAQRSDTFQTVSLVLNAGFIYYDLTTILPEKAREFVKIYKTNKTELNLVLKEDEINKLDDFVNKIDDELKDSEKIGEELAKIDEAFLAKYPNIRNSLTEVDVILKSSGFDRYRFENLIKQSNNLKYLEENSTLLPEIANEVKLKMQYTDADLLKIFKELVSADFVKNILPEYFVNTLKTFGKTDEEIVTYFKNYHNIYTKGEFFTQIEDILIKNNPYNLTKDEAYALWGYTTNFFYRDLNIWLRAGINTDKTTAISSLIKQGMQKVPKYNGMAYRALEFEGQALTDFISKYGKKGSVVTFNDFLSCGSTKEAAFFNKAEKNVRIIMEVKDVPIISSVADGIKYRGYSPEELLIDTRSEFQITGIDFVDGIYEIRMIQLK